MVTTCEVSVDDAETVTGMVSALLAELGAGHVEAGVDTQLVAELLAMKERIAGFLAFAEERPVGLIMLSESAALFARGTYGIITELYVVPDQRSSGVAMALIDASRYPWDNKRVGPTRSGGAKAADVEPQSQLSIVLEARLLRDRPAPQIAVARPSLPTRAG